jgi:hypothetical protein
MISAGDGAGKIGNGLPPGGPGINMEWDDEELRTNPRTKPPDERFGTAPVDMTSVVLYAVVPSYAGRDYRITRLAAKAGSDAERSSYFRGIVDCFVAGLRRFASSAFPTPSGMGVEQPLPADLLPVENLIERDIRNSHPAAIFTDLFREKASASEGNIADMLAERPHETGVIAYAHDDGESASWTKAGLLFNDAREVLAFSLSRRRVSLLVDITLPWVVRRIKRDSQEE